MSALLLALSLACLQDPAPPKPDDKLSPDKAQLTAHVEELAKRTLEQEGVPALGIAIARGDEVLLARGFGWADAARAVPANEETIFTIGSLTRQFTAVAILRLADEEKLGLDDELTKHLPAFPAAGRKVTLRQLLANTSGVPKYSALVEKHPEAAGPAENEAAFFARFKDVPFAFDPGTDFSQDSTGYALLSLVVAKVSGKSYETYVIEELLKPLGMNDTVFCPSKAGPRSFARGCEEISPMHDLELPLAGEPKSATQSLCSNVLDLVKWNRALVGRTVFSEKASRLFMTPTQLPDGNSTNYGFAIGMTRLDKYKSYSHTGGIGGFRVRLAYYSAPEVTIVVLANCASAPVDQIERELASLMLELAPHPVLDVSIEKADFQRFVGVYQIATTRIQIREHEGKLWYELPTQEPIRLLSQGGGVFVLDSDHEIQLVFKGEGERADSFERHQGGFISIAKRFE